MFRIQTRVVQPGRGCPSMALLAGEQFFGEIKKEPIQRLKEEIHE